MILDRLFKIARSYVYDIVEKGEEKFGLDSDYTDDEFERWKEEQFGKYDKEYGPGGSKSSSSYGDDDSWTGSSSRRKKTVNKDKEYFKVLEMEPTKDFAVIKKQYRKLMKANHPDRFQNEEAMRERAEKITAKLNEAYAYFEKKYDK